VRAVPRLGELYPGICFTTEEKARKTLSQGLMLIKFLSREVLVTTELLYRQYFVVYFVFNDIKHAYILQWKYKVINVSLNACPFCSFFEYFFKQKH
jgi:hypothetical protein